MRWKVRPTRNTAPPPCAAELAAMLACFAATSDLRAQGEGTNGCASAARQLHACMKKGGGSGKKQSSSINYLLSRVK
ncbi:unnamed protein product [Cutaneotrichosporon oleaginosum]